MAAPEYQFSSDAVRVQYAQDKVRQYTDMVNVVPQAFKDLTPTEVMRVADHAAPYLAKELNSIGIVYRGEPKEGV